MPESSARRRWASLGLAATPFLAVAAGWLLAPRVLEYPRYLLPPVSDLWTRLLQMLADGSLAHHTGVSLLRLGTGFVVGEDGRRFAKRDGSITLARLRADGVAPATLRAELGF